MERATMLAVSDAIGPDDLGLPIDAVPSRAPSGPPAGSADGALTLEEVERRHIAHIIDLAEGSRTRAATMLGISRSTLWEKGKKFGLL
jgi:DNA-binding NtrC family response regulator